MTPGSMENEEKNKDKQADKTKQELYRTLDLMSVADIMAIQGHLLILRVLD